MKRKSWAVALAVLLLSLVLVACGGGSSSDDGSGSDQKVITYALWDKEQAPVYQEIAKDFEKENPDVKVKFEITPFAQYFTKLETAITGKNAPDVFWVNIPRAPDYINNGVLMPVDDVKFDKDKIPEQYLKAYSKDGKLYGVPKDFDTNALFYNKKMFDDAGISYPDDTWTWATWQDAAKKLTKADENIYGLAAPLTWQGGYYDTIYQNEGSPFVDKGKKSGFSDQATIDGVDFWYSFTKNGSATPLKDMAGTTGSELLLNGRVAMSVEGSYMVPVIFKEKYGKDNIDVAPLPKGKTRATTSNSLANVISAGTKNEDAAKRWVAFLSTKEASEKVAESGVVIPAYQGAADAWINAYPDKNLKVFTEAVDYAVPLPNTKNSSAAIAIESDVLSKAWTGEESIEAACKELADKANALLNK
ncbi:MULTISPECIES: sugar ABC transporter substrate-binding protein [Listeria]|uniref:ABC transporter substrate-binding protein n=1 Tax=Listeria TaxID=1637 RepID=UPI000B591EFB|nr:MULTISPECIES: sugar ABC transporter substrate-binding protein [Listeria]